METTSVLQMFAIDKSQQVRSVQEVARGLACECTCPSCGEKVIARQGDVREWHFAHTTGHDCVNGAETALHLAAKQIIMQYQGITIPERMVVETVTLKDGRVGEGIARRPESWLAFQKVEAEMTFGSVRPDIVAHIDNSYFFIEIAVTHFIDEAKLIFLRNELKIPTLEINLSELHHTAWDWESLQEAILTDVSNKIWLKVLDDTNLIIEARELALQHALSIDIPESLKNTAIEPKRTRFFINHRILDIIERPFGIAVWSQYDPNLNAILKHLMRLLGGRWQPKFKNWLVPLEAKQFLFEAITELANQPPKHMPEMNEF